MTPAELEYYRQQQQPEEGGLLDFLGKAALAAGAVAGGIAGTRYLRGRMGQEASKQLPKRPAAPNYDAVRRAAATQLQENPAITRSQTPPPPGSNADRVRRMEQITREARAERMPGVIQTDLAALVAEQAVPSSRYIPSAPWFSETAPTRVAPAQNQVAGIEAGERLVQDPELLSLVRQQQAEELSEMRSAQAKAQAEYRNLLSATADEILAETRAKPKNFLQEQLEQSGYVPTQVEKQQASVPVIADQSVNAVYSAEDQQTGRIKQQLQRNEDVDLSKIELQEDMAEASRQAMINEASPSQMIGYEADAAINQVASRLPDGLPVDQAEGIVKSSAQRFLQNERDEIASQLGEQNLKITPSRIEQELANRLTKSAYQYGPKYSARKQALELYAQTGDPILLNRIQRFGMAPVSFETFETMPVEKRIGFENAPPFSTSYYPSEEVFAKGLNSDINVNIPTRGQTSLAEFRKPVITENTAQQAEEFYQTRKGQALDWLGDLRVQLEPKRNQILKERRAIVEQTADKLMPQLNAARQSGDQQLTKELEQNLSVLRNVWKNPRLGSHREDELRLLDAQITGAQNKITEDIASIQKKYPTTIADWSGESARIFGELNTETGELIPESIEIRGDRPSRELQPKGGGGRNIAEYTAGERLDEEIRNLQGGVRMRDYDIETGAPVQRWQGDRTNTESLPTTRQEVSRGVIATKKVVPVTTQFKGEPGVGRTIDVYGVRRDLDPADNPALKPSQPIYTESEIVDEAFRLAPLSNDAPFANDYELLREQAIESLGYQAPTPERRASVDVSRKLRQLQLTGKPGEADNFLTRFKQGLI